MLEPVADQSDTNQLRSSVLVHLSLLELLKEVRLRFPNVLDVVDGETASSIRRFEGRLRALEATGINASTVRFVTGDFEAMYTNLNWPQSLD